MIGLAEYAYKENRTRFALPTYLEVAEEGLHLITCVSLQMSLSLSRGRIIMQISVRESLNVAVTVRYSKSACLPNDRPAQVFSRQNTLLDRKRDWIYNYENIRHLVYAMWINILHKIKRRDELMPLILRDIDTCYDHAPKCSYLC